jgi:hypothetical protein
LQDSKVDRNMAIDVAPGTLVQVKVTHRPRRAAGVKTLERLFRKDSSIKKAVERLQKTRVTRFDRRGGRPWGDRPPQLQPFKIERGASCKIVASVDVIKDLASLGDTVEITPAK